MQRAVERRGVARRVGEGAGLLLLTLLSGCARGCTSSQPPIHLNPNMDVQPRYEAQAGSAFFYDGGEMRPPIEGTIARGELRDESPYWTGKDAASLFVPTVPIEVTDAVLARGHRRYDIYCGVCHDQHGDGRGVLFERAKVPTASFHTDRLRAMPAGQIFDTITNGRGLMPSYRYPIPVADRWAIIAYIRQLQARRLERSHATMPPIATVSAAGDAGAATTPAAGAAAGGTTDTAAAAASPAPAAGTPPGTP
jgi:hypothetical protein